MPNFRFVLAVVVALAHPGWEAAWALDADTFEAEVAALARSPDKEKSLRQLDALVVEAMQAGRTDLQVMAARSHARLQIKSGQLRDVRQNLEEALTLARQSGLAGEESRLDETFADYWLAQGDPVVAAEWLDRAWSLALAQRPPDPTLAGRALDRLADLRRAMGQPHLADQADAWRAMLTGAATAPPAGVEMQPVATTTQIATTEVGRTRLFLANASLAPVTGTLLIDGGDLMIKNWASRGEGEVIALQFPAVAAAVPITATQGRKLTLRPGETRTITIEVEPNAPPRPGDKTVSIVWQAGTTSLTSTATFHFRRAREMADTSVANACHVRLSPLVSVPIYMEVYHRGDVRRHVQDLLPATSQPCRVEIYEILPNATQSREWLAVDADGDGRFDGAADAVAADRDRSGYPDVSFSRSKPVVALEIRLYPLPAADDSLSPSLDLTVSLRDGPNWRHPPDVSHRVEKP